WKEAQCGQVGEAYSITVTGASALPSTLSVRPPAGSISLAVSIMSPSAACALERPERLTAEAAAARMIVSRRLNFTSAAPEFFMRGDTTHGDGVGKWASPSLGGERV